MKRISAKNTAFAVVAALLTFPQNCNWASAKIYTGDVADKADYTEEAPWAACVSRAMAIAMMYGQSITFDCIIDGEAHRIFAPSDDLPWELPYPPPKRIQPLLYNPLFQN